MLSPTFCPAKSILILSLQSEKERPFFSLKNPFSLSHLAQFITQTFWECEMSSSAGLLLSQHQLFFLALMCPKASHIPA